ncbi:MAG: NACHT domain-containing protein, partial [Crocosphaera sp.]
AYRIGGRLLLTCGHLFDSNNNDCKVRFRSASNYSDKQDIAAKVIWKAPDNIDIALIELPKTIEICDPVSFGQLPDANTTKKVKFDFLGFPQFLRYSEDNKKYATGLHIEGIIDVANRPPHNRLLLNIKDNKAIQPTDEQLERLGENQSPWEGTSGAAIVCHGLIIGVQSRHPIRDRPTSLEAESLARVYDNKKWCEILEKHGINSQAIPVKSNWLSPEDERKAIHDLLTEIESYYNKIRLFHSPEEVTLKDQYIPIQVTLERRYKNKLETLSSYAESEEEAKKLYALKGMNEEAIKKTQEDWKTAKQKESRIIVLADPGMGKSTLLRMEVCQTVEQAKEDLKAGKEIQTLTIPLFIRFSSLADKTDLTISEAILKIIQDRHEKLLKTSDKTEVMAFLNKFLEQQLRENKFLLLLDALDEVPQEKRPNLLKKLTDFVGNYPNCKIVATSRIVSYGGNFLSNGKEMEIVPFTQAKTEEYINRWFDIAKPSLKDDSITPQWLIQALKERPQISGLVQNPLLLSLICSLYQQDKLTLPARRGQIYEQAVNYMLGKWCIDNNRKGSTEAEIESKKDILRELAYQFSQKGTEVFSIRILKKKIKEYLRRENATNLDKTANDLIDQLSNQDGILQKLNSDQSEYLFLHRTFQEYFTALYLSYQIEDAQDRVIELVKQYFWDYDWHETITLLAGLLDEPMVLIEAIRGEKDDIFKTQLMLAGRCLGEYDAINNPTVEEII